jgi:histidinol-phosphate aminotransferase
VLGAITNKTRLIVICNPNNPTGTLTPVEDILKISKAAPKVVILVDECYFEFSQISVAAYIRDYPNLVITRTLSKTWGLAGLRFGFIIAHPEIIRELQKIRGPYDVNAIASIAAQAALENQSSFLEYANEIRTISRPLICDYLRSKAIPFWETFANFVLIHHPEAAKLYDIFLDSGIRTRPRSGPNIDKTIRITIGTKDEILKVIECLDRSFL